MKSVNYACSAKSTLVFTMGNIVFWYIRGVRDLYMRIEEDVTLAARLFIY